MYIVVEGPDMAGKSTFIKKLEQKYKKLGKEIITVTEPYMGHYTGQMIRDYQKEKHTNSNDLYDLYKQNRKYLWCSIIQPALQAGQIVISDRNFISSMVYQQGMGMMNILRDNNDNHPDMVYFLTISHETYCKRLKNKLNLELIEKELGKKEIFTHHVNRYKEACSLLSRVTNTLVIPVGELPDCVNCKGLTS